MKDMTQGSIQRHLVGLAVPIAIGMLFQTLYFVVDLYFVARLGQSAIAGVGSAGNASFLVLALTQVLGVGTTALIAQAVGRKDPIHANQVFNQSLVMSAFGAVGCLVLGYSLIGVYAGTVSADPATSAAGVQYLCWYLPGLALQFALVAMASALRGTGIAKPTMTVQMLTVVLNTVLAPVLIAGVGTGHALGVAGAGLASSISVAVGVVLLWMYFLKLEHYVGVDRKQWRPSLGVWKQILAIGLPAGGEFVLMFIVFSFVYWVIRPFGPAAQAGFGIGSRMMQAIFLPCMAIAFAVAPVAGQNFGARLFDRVRATFRHAALLSVGIMLVVTLLCQWQPSLLVCGFTRDPAVIAVGADYLRIISWNFVATGVVFSCSGMLQALGNTLPALLSSASRFVTFMLPVAWLATRPGFRIVDVWHFSVASVSLQAVISLLLLRVQLRKRLV